MTVFEKNIAVIRQRYPEIAQALLRAPHGTAYKEIRTAKTGVPVPILTSGQALHSLYNPEREAERLFTDPVGFMLFCGLGAGIQIQVFLKKHPHAVCALTEVDDASFKQLLSLIDYSSLLADMRVLLLPPCTDAAFITALMQSYIPSLHGTFANHVLRPWSEAFKEQTMSLSGKIEQALRKIKADFSVQAHFGKIWLRNIMCNLRLAAQIKPKYPSVHTDRTAIVLGAGPSLEKKIEALTENRQSYCIFCTDTVLPVLSSCGIIPDFFIAIDPQHISYLHTIGSIPQETIGIFDLCANAAVVRRWYANGNRLFFTAGEHPLAQDAARFSPFPLLSTGSGTVAVAAYHAAQSLGFRHIECSGMDFAYTNGAAYTRGTYLSQLYANEASRLLPQEAAFVRLIFRSEIYTEQSADGLTYRSALLDSYREAFEMEKTRYIRWLPNEFKTFPYNDFFRQLILTVQDTVGKPPLGLLPFLAWCRLHGKEKFTLTELVSELISEYTSL